MMSTEEEMMVRTVPNSAWKYLLSICALLGIGCGAYLWNKTKKGRIKNDISNK